MNEKRRQYQQKYYLEHKEKLNRNTPHNKERKRKYYENHKEQILARTQEYYKNHKDEHNTYTKNHYQKHKKEHSDWAKEYNKKHKLEIQAQKRIYHQNNKDKIIRYYQKNKKKINERYKDYAKTEEGKIARRKSHFKRRKKMTDVIEIFTMQEWNKKLGATNGICIGFECEQHFVGKEKLTIDHTLAISKAPKGFIYTINDVQPLCKNCNSRKKNKL